VKSSLTDPTRHDGPRSGVVNADPDHAIAIEVAEASRRLLNALQRRESPEASVGAARDMLTAAEATLQAVVDRARADGQSWRDIGAVLGTSRQAAFQRFGHPPVADLPVAREITPGSQERATAFVELFTANRWEELLDHFDDRMREHHDAERLASGWAHLTGMFGRIEATGDVTPVPVGDSTVVDVILRFEAGEAMLWVRYDPDGRVSGLRLHPVSG
jgi:hypothetical protein